jgi:DNA modification methylase|tara:strand:+ start:3256 stop:4467 length:1212 start_codon:yes stop_codon:yes gene_type:complete
MKWPADKIERRKVDALIPYARNARTHSDEQVAQLAASIKEWGWTTPVLIDEDGEIIAGHGRVMAARKLDIDEIPTMTASGWTKAQKQAYVLADNQLPQNAGWDMDLLSVEMKDLDSEGFDLSLIGFGDDIMANMLVDPTEGLTDEDAVPDVPENPVTVLGDVWMLGNHRLMCGDSTSIDAVDKLMAGQKADMVFTDPPYGLGYDGGSKKRDKLIDDHVGTDIYTDSVPIMAMYCTGPIYTWYADTKPEGLYSAVEAAGDIHSLIIWEKNNSTFNMGINYKQKHELCLYWKPKNTTLKWAGGSAEDTVWEIKREARNDFHPTQKPVELSERAIGNHSVDLILDLFGGSGSTLIACEKLNRNARLMELDPKYCDVIVQRWQDFTGQQAKLEGSGEYFPTIKEDAA